MKICILFLAIVSVSSVSGALTTFSRSLSPAINNFTYNFYKSLADRESGNLICSPLSVDIVLSMTNFGARGNTGKQLESSLNLSSDKNDVKRGFQQLISSLNNVQGVELKLANKIFITEDASLQPDFQEIMKTYFQSETQSVAFTKCYETAQIINDWCAEKTQNCITNVVEPNDIEEAVMVLVNAVYFKGQWASKFDTNFTRPLPFYIDDKTIKTVPTMRQWGFFNWGYISDVNARYIELPYESKDDSEAISMFIILPYRSTKLRDVENNIHKVNFAGLMSKYPLECILQLPKFKIGRTFDLKLVLQNMGITEIFKKTANLNGIVENADLVVSKIVHKAFIEVNEEGSEAAAITGEVSRIVSGPEQIYVNKPFLCAIVMKRTGVPLFIARVIDPTIES